MAADYDDACAAAIEWLRSLPAQHQIGWNTHHFSLDWPFSKGWVDVFVPELQEAAGWNWAWTVEQEDDPEHDETADPFSLTAPFDAILQLRSTGDKVGWDDVKKEFVSAVDRAVLLVPSGEEHRSISKTTVSSGTGSVSPASWSLRTTEASGCTCRCGRRMRSRWR